jgi:hypothetical protein
MGVPTFTRICRVGRDGNVVVNVGIEYAGEEVDVIIRPVGVPGRTAGAIDDPTFKRHEQGHLEQRDALG